MMKDLKLIKGQILTSDFVASIVLFSFFLVLFGSIWNTSVDLFSQGPDTESLQHDYTFSLLKTSGFPSDWNSTNVEIPGLYNDGRLEAEKVLELKNVSNSSKRSLLRAQELHLKVENLNGTLKTFEGEKLKTFTDSGNNRVVPQNKTVHVSEKQSVLYETGERVELRYYSWE